MPQEDRKETLRRATLAARSALSPADWEAQDAARAGCLWPLVPSSTPGTVALYASRPGEPATDALIDGFAAAGWDVLLPILRRQPDWGRYTGRSDLVPGWADIPEPAGPRLGAAALAQADLVVVSALAVSRDGYRLGVGGGWYDRALAHRSPDARVVALCREAELVESVPVEPHDRPVDGVATERSSLLFNQ